MKYTWQGKQAEIVNKEKDIGEYDVFIDVKRSSHENSGNS